MAITDHTAIEQLYLAYFNRPADAAGLAYWDAVAQARQGDLSAMSAAFAGSAEYRSTYAGMTSKAIVATIYQNLFGRPADSAGASYWGDLLTAGTLGIDTIVKDIADGARLSDKTAFDNKVSAATAFTAALDTPQEIAAYARADAGPAARAFLNAVTTDATLASAIAPGVLDATIRDLVLARTTALTGNKDTLTSDAGHTVFAAPLRGDQATLQSGDRVTAGTGTIDVLRAEMTDQHIEAVAPVLAGIDRIELRVSASAAERAALLDASGIDKTTHYVSDRSEADLLIENISLNEASIGQVKVEMRGTAAGDVDLGVYFQGAGGASLGEAAAPESSLRLQLLDLRSMEHRGIPLLENPFSRFTFDFNGKPVTVQSAGIDAATHYEEMVQAIGAAVAATPGLDRVRVQLGASFDIAAAGGPQQGREIVLYSVGNDSFGSDDAAFGTNGAIPASDMHNKIRAATLSPSAAALSSIILDGVGRGSQGGDLLVGSMQTGGFTEGVARFDIEVRNSSSLQTIGSTNNALRDVTIHNGYASKEEEIGKGALAVLGGGKDIPLPKAAPAASGFTDVRTIDASAMQGAFSFTAAITTASLDKYALPGGSGATNHFAYTGGAGNDQMHVTVAGDILAANSQLGTNEDFMVVTQGGGGDDAITLAVIDGARGWYDKHAGNGNLLVNAGAGNDVLVVSGAANVIADLGSGNDRFVTGGASAGDNIISGGAGDDRIALSTVTGSSADTSSNDTLRYSAEQFGNDVVSNFNSGGAALGGDRLDFSALGGRGSAFAGAAISLAWNSIAVQQHSAANDTAADIAALYAGHQGGATHVFVAVDSANVGKVYALAESAATGVTATLVGTIDLATTPWAGLTGASFV